MSTTCDEFEAWFDCRDRAEYPVRFHSWQAGYQAGRRAALEAKWQPIETAPRDGTWLLVAGPDRTGARRMVCRWMADRQWESADDGHGAYINPTHWMPLLEAPALAGGTQEGQEP